MGLTILIVDDSKLARLSLIKSLNALLSDFACIEARDTEEALGVVSSTPPDIALVDYNLPGLNGHYVATELRKGNPQMPIAILREILRRQSSNVRVRCPRVSYLSLSQRLSFTNS